MIMVMDADSVMLKSSVSLPATGITSSTFALISIPKANQLDDVAHVPNEFVSNASSRH